jgi:hypothetical protein
MSDKEPVTEFTWTAENAHLFPGFGVPSIFINRFQILVQNGVCRLAFGEALFGEPMRAQVSVTMSNGDAAELARVLGELVNQVISQTGPQGTVEDGAKPTD